MTENELDLIEVESPCTQSWEAMRPIGGATRFCSRCRSNVYDISRMSRREAVEWIQKQEGRTCVRFHRRPDGRVLTRECRPRPAGPRRWAFAVAIAGFGLGMSIVVAGAVLGVRPDHEMTPTLYKFKPLAALLDWLFPPPVVMGGVCAPPFLPNTPDPVDDERLRRELDPVEP